MCSQVKIDGQVKSVGDLVTVLTKFGPVTGPLGGCARTENFQAYWQDVLIRGELRADSYFEAKQEFCLQPGTRLLVGVCSEDSKHHAQGEILIFTREAATELESLVHNRHPVIVEASYELAPA